MYPTKRLDSMPVVLYQAGLFRRSDVLVPLEKKYPNTVFASTNDLQKGKGNLIYVKYLYNLGEMYTVVGRFCILF